MKRTTTTKTSVINWRSPHTTKETRCSVLELISHWLLNSTHLRSLRAASLTIIGLLTQLKFSTLIRIDGLS